MKMITNSIAAVSVEDVHKMVKSRKPLIILMLFVILGFSTLSLIHQKS